VSRQEAALSSYEQARRAWAAHLRQCLTCAPLERYADALAAPVASMCERGARLFAAFLALRRAAQTP
jgi:hypothetical protein